MTEYIDRTALLDNLPDEPYKGVLRRILMQAPVADVAPVVHGKWMAFRSLKQDGYGEKATIILQEIFACAVCGNVEKIKAPYCRYCGAKMGGEMNNARAQRQRLL